MTRAGANMKAEVPCSTSDLHWRVGVGDLDALADMLKIFLIQRDEHCLLPINPHAAAARVGTQKGQDPWTVRSPTCCGYGGVIRKSIRVRGRELFELAQQFVRASRKQQWRQRAALTYTRSHGEFAVPRSAHGNQGGGAGV
jgi:hypothetical protein